MIGDVRSTLITVEQVPRLAGEVHLFPTMSSPVNAASFYKTQGTTIRTVLVDGITLKAGEGEDDSDNEGPPLLVWLELSDDEGPPPLEWLDLSEDEGPLPLEPVLE